MNIPELSLCFNPNQQSSFLLDLLKSSTNPLINKLQINIHPMLWGDYKKNLVEMALRNSGSDMSQVGFPLTGDLIGMNALLPIAGQFITKIGGQTALHPICLEHCKPPPGRSSLSMPWLIDPRAIFYWKDMVDKTGASPHTAFASPEQMEDTCQRMKAKGIEYPWILGMADKFVVIHAIASWVWSKGGDFTLPKGNHAVFLEPPALDGMEAFFRLSQYMPPENLSFSASRISPFLC